jgi:hypothetical protein
MVRSLLKCDLTLRCCDGRQVGHSPAQLAGLDVPDDPFVLLGLVPGHKSFDMLNHCVSG